MRRNMNRLQGRDVYRLYKQSTEQECLSVMLCIVALRVGSKVVESCTIIP